MQDVVKITVVGDAPCPECGASWGGSPDYPNRPKVGMEDGWWWRCYNPGCPVTYYNPDNGGVEKEAVT